MSKLITKIEGAGDSCKTILVNIQEIAKAIYRPPIYPTKYFGCELKVQIEVDFKNDCYIVNGSHETTTLQDLLDKFIKKLVLCPNCEKLETLLLTNENTGTIQLDCKACRHKATVDLPHKLSTLILKCPPDLLGDSLPSFTIFSSTNVNAPPVKPSEDHKVYIKLPIPENGVPLPYPDSYADKWDNKHVKMPNSPKHRLGEKNRWSIICGALKQTFSSIAALNAAILSYNPQFKGRWKFPALTTLVEHVIEENEREEFFETTLPKIIQLALDLPTIVTRPLLLLKKDECCSLSLSQKQISCLLANAFLCTFPYRNKGQLPEYKNYPDINFDGLFAQNKPNGYEKIRCILNYLKSVTSTTNEPDGVVTFSRQSISLEKMPNFKEIDSPFLKCCVDSKTGIEEMKGLLQVDFADPVIGGCVLTFGCVQEEIRFVLSPELIVARLFTEILDRRESLIIIGTEQFNRSEGYAASFKWTGSFEDVTLRDNFKRRLCQVVAIDAMRFGRQKKSKQYQIESIQRELQKAFAGFHVVNGSSGNPVAVATGNWGCGVFRGNPRLKSLLQLIAAGATGRDLVYCSFGDVQLQYDILRMHNFLMQNKVTIGKLVSILCQYASSKEEVDGKDLYDYIYAKTI